MVPAFATDRLPAPGDPARAARGLESWRDAAAMAEPDLAVFARELAESPEGRRLLDAITGNSPYLGLSLTRDLPFARRLLTDGFDVTFKALMAEVKAAYGEETDINRLMTGLRLAKRRAALLIGLADIAGAWALERVTGALSELAETTLELAATHLLRAAAAKGSLRLPDARSPLVGSGLIILAMGKFGARELNYSSDIDLIVLYDDATVETADPDNLARTFIRFARDLVRIMDERTRDGYVFRTDLRLRPDPGATPAAVAVSAAEIYYASVGQNWERAAMIKARPVASDPAAAAGFMATIRSFVWRRSLDFAAIQDIHSVKRQIHAHKGHRVPAVNGHDIKLGRGGIREIEFFIQTQQLIYGGRDDRLRIAPTCEALRAFVAVGRVRPEVAEEMIAAYRFLRQVEHRLQMVDDRQTHQLPKSDEEVAQIAVFLGFTSACAFREALLSHLMRVEGHYAELFEEAPTLAGPGNLMFTGTDDDPGTLDTLRGMGFGNPSGVIATVAAWHRGRYRCMRNARARELLTELTPALLTALGRTHHPDEALSRFDQFMSRLPSGIQLFSLFHAKPGLLDFIAEVMGTAPQLAEWLSRKPGLLDSMVAPDYFDPLPGKAELLADYRRAGAEAGNFEDVLNLGRRWVQDQSFRAGVHILRGITDGDRCGPFLSAIAEIVLDDLAAKATDEFARRHGRIPGGAMAIIAMGKLGSGQMTIASDLDLITVYQVPPEVSQSDGPKPLAPSEYYIKLTQSLINAVTAPTAEGRLYEVDMRLRPSGTAGPVAVSLDAFTRYQHENAWTWEHMALTRARVVSGPPELKAKLEAVALEVLTKPRDPVALVIDVADMRRRIQREHATKNPWEVKYARGGFIDINFIAQYLMLRHAPAHPGVISPNTVRAFEKLQAAGVLEAQVAAELILVHRTWRRVQGFLRIATGGGLEPNDAPEAIQAALGRCVFPEAAGPVLFRDTDARVRELAALAYQHFQALIDEPAEQEHLTRQRNQYPPD